MSINKMGDSQFKLIMAYVEQQLEAEFRDTLPDSQAEDDLFEKVENMGLFWMVHHWRDVNMEGRVAEEAKKEMEETPIIDLLQKTFNGK